MAAGRQGGGDLGSWLADQGFAPEGPGGIADMQRVRTLLLAAAREGRALSYSELLGALGHRFTRPKMRALCRTLDAIDAAGKARGEPDLAVLVVRESDRLPGQGWWIGVAERLGYRGEWTGPLAAGLVREQQERAFGYWAEMTVGIANPSIVADCKVSPNATSRRSAKPSGDGAQS